MKCMLVHKMQGVSPVNLFYQQQKCAFLYWPYLKL